MAHFVGTDNDHLNRNDPHFSVGHTPFPKLDRETPRATSDDWWPFFFYNERNGVPVFKFTADSWVLPFINKYECVVMPHIDGGFCVVDMSIQSTLGHAQSKKVCEDWINAL